VVFRFPSGCFGLLCGFKKKDSGASFSQQSLNVRTALDEGLNFLPPIPKGFRIYAARLGVAGTEYRHDDARQFAEGSDQTLEFERDPSNPHDPNAMKVIGVDQRERRFIGYVPRGEAEQIVGSGLAGIVQGRLERIWRRDDGFIYVRFQVIGPKAMKEQYDDFLRNKPADAWQKDFLRFFGLPLPSGMTRGQAEKAIAEHRGKEDKSILDEYDAYQEIRDQFDDSDFLSDYELKRVSSALLKEALDDLKRSGSTMVSMADNIDVVVDKIVALKPSVRKI
jgi:hypothetical protein